MQLASVIFNQCFQLRFEMGGYAGASQFREFESSIEEAGRACVKKGEEKTRGLG